MLKKIFPILIVLTLVACGDDDNGIIDSEPPRLLADQSVEDDTAIQEYLATHFYELVEDGTGGLKVSIDTIAGENASRTPMRDNGLITQVVNVSSDQIGLSVEENDIPHNLYYIVAREGADDGLQPTIADSTLIKYEGSLLNRNKFDGSTNFTWQELPNFLRGYGNAIANFKSGTTAGLVQNGDGSSYYTNSGIGIVVMPSGLAYFLGSPSTAIPSYAPLVFTFEVGNVIPNTDTDNDGVPSILEDLNGNGYLFDDNTDVDSEANAGVPPFANFRDNDDDDDGVSTRDEISDADGNIITPYPDSDGDGTPDYLDPDIQRDPNN